jgi:release factor glutamine methyltransferase
MAAAGGPAIVPTHFTDPTVFPKPETFAKRRGLSARLARRWFRLRFRALQQRRYNRPDLARVGDLSLVVIPGVFHPEFFFATAFFIRTLARRPIDNATRALDMGTGSGAIAVALGLRGARVTAVDINPLAVRCARANLNMHGLDKLVTALESDLFDAVADDHYDLITFNPPFYPRAPRDMADRAWAAGEGSLLLWRFLDGARIRLKPGGEVLVGGSTEAPYTASLMRMPGWCVRIVGQREMVGERLFVLAMRPR